AVCRSRLILIVWPTDGISRYERDTRFAACGGAMMTVRMTETKITCVCRVAFAAAILLAALLAGTALAVAQSTAEPQLRQQQQALHTLQQQALEAYEHTDYTPALGCIASSG